MNTSPAPLTHKLILLVLCLILACLAFLVVRGFRPATPPEPAADTIAATPPQTDEIQQTLAAEEDPTPAVAPPLRRSSVRNRTVMQPPRSVRESAPTLASTTDNPGTVENPISDSAATAVSVREVFAGPTVGEAGGASVFGRVTLNGRPKAEIPIELGPSCGPLRTGPKPTTRHFVVGPDGGLANVLVFVHAFAERAAPSQEMFQRHLGQSLPLAFAPAANAAFLDQVGCMFEPYVLAVQVGQVLRVRNSDPVLHNLHFTPRQNPERNVGQPRQGQINDFTFARPELFIRLKCDVHPWMFSYTAVGPHPFFAITDTNGVFRIPSGLPAGNYALSAFHLRAGGSVRDFQYSPGLDTRMDFELSVPETSRQSRVARVK